MVFSQLINVCDIINHSNIKIEKEEYDMQFITLSESEFSQFANTHELRNLWQTTEMAHLREQRGFKIYYVGVKDDNKLLAATMLTTIPVFLKYTLAQALRGYLIDFKNKELLAFFHQEITNFLRKKNCLELKIDPYFPYVEHDLDGNIVTDGFNNQDVLDHLLSLGYKHVGFTHGLDTSYEPRWIYTIPYKGRNADELLKSFERKALRSIKKAEKYNVTVRELPFDQIDLYMQVMEHTEGRRGFHGRDKAYYENLYTEYSKNDNIKFLYAELKVDDYIKSLQDDLQVELKVQKDCLSKMQNGVSTKMQNKLNVANQQIEQIHNKIEEAETLKQTDGETLVLSSGVFFTYGKETLCLMSGVYDKYMRFASPYAMHWKMMQESIEKGQERYNLYGISGEFDSDSEGYGVYLFKKGFNGEVLELIGDFVYVFKPITYKVYNTLRSIKHKIKK